MLLFQTSVTSDAGERLVSYATHLWPKDALLAIREYDARTGARHTVLGIQRIPVMDDEMLELARITTVEKLSEVEPVIVISLTE